MGFLKNLIDSTLLADFHRRRLEIIEYSTKVFCEYEDGFDQIVKRQNEILKTFPKCISDYNAEQKKVFVELELAVQKAQLMYFLFAMKHYQTVIQTAGERVEIQEGLQVMKRKIYHIQNNIQSCIASDYLHASFAEVAKILLEACKFVEDLKPLVQAEDIIEKAKSIHSATNGIRKLLDEIP